MSGGQHNPMQILKDWVLYLRIGNDPTPGAWAEVHDELDRMPEA